MARPKEFDRDDALRKAMLVFWQQGYEATSTDDLLRAMGIGRQSLYDTFGDKHRLYLEALGRYREETAPGALSGLTEGPSPLEAIEAALMAIPKQTSNERARGCMMVNATTELAQSDADVAAIVRTSASLCEAAFERAVRRAQKLGQLPAALDARAAGRFLYASLLGLRVTAKAGASPEALRDVARLALAGLGAR
ncbi:MAG: Transcriptional regulatory protein [Labilithrix sp.]|nr:Transcriptional regulatory protein [Labilithrix sp.]